MISDVRENEYQERQPWADPGYDEDRLNHLDTILCLQLGPHPMHFTQLCLAYVPDKRTGPDI